MQNQTNLDKLNDKVTQILQNYNTYKDENKTLRTEIVTLKAENAAKNNEIERLRDVNVMKDLEIEEIVEKIESILG
ncbi:MAG: chromosome segregation ATPase [Sulfurimonas sp.]